MGLAGTLAPGGDGADRTQPAFHSSLTDLRCPKREPPAAQTLCILQGVLGVQNAQTKYEEQNTQRPSHNPACIYCVLK